MGSIACAGGKIVLMLWNSQGWLTLCQSMYYCFFFAMLMRRCITVVFLCITILLLYQLCWHCFWLRVESYLLRC